MDLISKFRDKATVKSLLHEINKNVEDSKSYNIMEVCGTHTMSISKFGIRTLLPKPIRLITGPGCPVCVTSQGEIDCIFELLENNDIILATYGDMMRVPGSNKKNLLDMKAAGKDIRVVISPLDILKIREKSDKEIVFVSIGFETTNPATAVLVDLIVKKSITGIYVLMFNKTMPEIINVLLEDSSLNIDGFLCPGHVSVITGEKLYIPMVKKGKAAVVTGFEPVDVLSSILEIVKQINTQSFKIVNNYKRTVKANGNRLANDVVDKYFEKVDAIWRGVGVVKNSGLGLKGEYKYLDATERFGLNYEKKGETPGCRCGDVLKGKILPIDCPLYERECTFENPIGPCMVSSEGACAAYYKYEKGRLML